MTTKSPMAIKLERFIKAPPMEVWRAIVDPSKFFLTFVGLQFIGPFETGKLTPLADGEETSFVFVDEATPGKRLVIRWNYDPEDGKTFVLEKSTLVEFELIEQEGGTLLKFSESEFENLPEKIRQTSCDNVDIGWPSMIHDLGSYVERGEDAWLVAQSYGAISAPLEVVWNAVKNLRVFTQMMRFEGEVKVGQVVTLYFGESHGGLPILITKIEEQERYKELVFRWHHEETDPQAPFDTAETTLVSFGLMQMEGSVWMIMKESEFDNLPKATRRATFDQQVKAWEGGVELFAKTFEKGESK